MRKRINKITSYIISAALVISSFSITGVKSEVDAIAASSSSTLVWSDEFNGSSLDTSRWGYEIGTGSGGWGNNEWEYYTDRTDNVYLSDGYLHIRAKKENYNGSNYTSGRIISRGKFEFTHGYVEARIAIPKFNGIWPAFWALGSNIGSVGWPACGEIDILEAINAEDKVYGTFHWQAGGNHADYGNNMNLNNRTDFHTYALSWDENFMRIYCDGNQYQVMDISNGAGDTDEFQRPFFLLFNLAVAGNWPGWNVDDSGFPAEMLVDYVRVYQDTPNFYSTAIKNVDDGSGSVTPTQTTGAIPSGTELINPSFSSGAWNEYTEAGSTFSNNGNSVNVSATAVNGGTNYSTQVRQDGFQLTAGRWYKATYTVTSSQAKKFQLLIQNNSNWTVYGDKITEVAAGQTKKVELVFQAPETTNQTLMGIMMGNVDGTTANASNVTISDVSLKVYDSRPESIGETVITNPTTQAPVVTTASQQSNPVGNKIVLNVTNSTSNYGVEGTYNWGSGYTYVGQAFYPQATSSYKYLVVTYTGNITDIRFGNDYNPPTAVYWFKSGVENGTDHTFYTADGSVAPENGNNTTVVIDLARSGLDGTFFNNFHIHTGSSGSTGSLSISEAYLTDVNPNSEPATEAPTQTPTQPPTQPQTEAPTQAPTTVAPEVEHTDSFSSYGFNLNITQTTGHEVNQTIIEKMKEIYFSLYPHMRKRYNTARPRTVNLVFDPNYDGVAYTLGDKIVVSVDYISTHPLDVDCFTHELFHVAQGGYANYGSNGASTAFCEGMADYGRFLYGIYNKDSNWGLQEYNSSHSYTGSYGITGNFLLWISQNYDSEIGYYLNKAYHGGYYTDNFWVERCGKTVDQLWDLYAASPSTWNVKFDAFKGETWGIENGKAYKIISAESGKVLSVYNNSEQNGANVVQRSYVSGDDAQEWIFNHIGNGKYNIINKKTGKALEVNGGSSSNFANIQQNAISGIGASYQQWIPIEQGLYYTLFAVNGNGTMVADVNSSSHDENANVSIYTWNRTKAQKFIIVPADVDSASDYSLRAFDRIEAEDFTGSSTNIRVSVDDNTARSGGGNAGGLWAGAWMKYSDVIFDKDASGIVMNSCNMYNQSYVNVYVDSMNSSPVGRITIPHNSSDWNSYGTYEATLTSVIPSGVHDIYLEFVNDGMNSYAQNCDYFTFVESQPEPETEVPTQVPTEAPTEPPTEAPTEKPTEAPTTVPPTEPPTEAPKPTYTVTIDGDFVASVKEGNTYTLPSAGIAGYEFGGKMYKVGSTVTVNGDMDFESVEISSDYTISYLMNANSGIQYKMEVEGPVTSDIKGAGAVLVTASVYKLFKNVTKALAPGRASDVTASEIAADGSFKVGLAGLTDESAYIEGRRARAYLDITYTGNGETTPTTVYAAISEENSLRAMATITRNSPSFRYMSNSNKEAVRTISGIN